MPITLNGDTGITTPSYGGADPAEYLVPVTVFKNRIINGAMQVWQRATSGTTSGYCCADRWIFDNNGTYSRSTDVPAGFQYSLSVSVTTATRFGAFGQRIESSNCYDLVGNQVTLSFWIKTTSGSTAMTATLFRANAVDNFSGLTSIQSQSFTSSGSWTQVSLTYSSLPSLAANGLMVYIFSNDPSVTPTYLITGIQLEKGSTATSFDYRPYGQELQLCQRYYELSYSQGTAIATSTIAGATLGVGGSVNDIAVSGVFKVTKRASPTVTLYSPATGTSGAVRNYNTGADVTSSLVETGDSQFRVYKTSGFTSGSFYGFQWTSSAEL